MKKVLIYWLWLGLCVPAFTQKEEIIYTTVENPPQYIGGHAEMYRFLKENSKLKIIENHKLAKEKYFIKFVIEKDGSVSNVVNIQENYTQYFDEIKKTILSLPKWKPAINKEKPVRCYFVIPIYLK